MFRERLRNTRESLEISQTQMADMLGIAVTTYRNYENTTREPNYDILKNISKVLNVSTDYLLGIDSDNNYIDNISLKCSQLSNKSQLELDSFIDYLIYKEKTKKSEK